MRKEKGLFVRLCLIIIVMLFLAFCIFMGKSEIVYEYDRNAYVQVLNNLNMNEKTAKNISDAKGAIGALADESIRIRGGVENFKLKEYLDSHEELSDDEMLSALRYIEDTEKWIIGFDIERYMNDGINFSHIKGVDYKDENGIYDGRKLNLLFYQYEYIDRNRALSCLFEKIVGNEKNNVMRHEMIVDFLAKGIYHSSYTEPLDEDGNTIFDPLVLLTLQEMKCGNINRIGCDLYESVGYSTRLVQLNGHVVGEVFYDDELFIVK